jgi:hypothetical protein
MTQPCEQQDNIRDIQLVNRDILRNQELMATQHIQLVTKLDDFFCRLETILLADAERRTQLVQALQDVDQLFKDNRAIKKDLQEIHEWKATLEGAGILINFPKVWNFFQQEQGWRRFVPAAMSLVTGLLAIYITMHSVFGNSTSLSDQAILDNYYNRAEQSHTYGIPK